MNRWEEKGEKKQTLFQHKENQQWHLAFTSFVYLSPSKTDVNSQLRFLSATELSTTDIYRAVSIALTSVIDLVCLQTESYWALRGKEPRGLLIIIVDTDPLLRQFLARIRRIKFILSSRACLYKEKSINEIKWSCWKERASVVSDQQCQIRNIVYVIARVSSPIELRALICFQS